MNVRRILLLCLLAGLPILTVVATVQAQPVADGLVAYFPFDGDASDATGNGYDGTVTGATLAPDQTGQVDRCYAFDGDDHIVTSLMVESATGTVAAWAYVDCYQTGPGQRNLILGQSEELQLGLGDSGLGRDGHWFCRFKETYGGWNYVYGPLAELDTWFHVAAVWDGQYVRLYLNGQPWDANDAEAAYPASGNLVIGRESETSAEDYWFGMIDEVLFYDRALSPAEIGLLAEEPTANEIQAWGEIKASYR